ncbi:MAG: hypothetical protein JXQ97_09830 [Natronospirillum sp.]
MRSTFLTLLLLSSSAFADLCMELTGSGDGIPAEYYQQKCEAERYLANEEYVKAAEHYGQASAVRMFEAPNYNLRLEWGYSLCLAGQVSEGAAKIESFELMARADLGEFECPKDMEGLRSIIHIEHMELACIGYGSGLTEQGRQNMLARLTLAESYKAACANTH